MKLTVEQANAMLALEPFAIVRVCIDNDGELLNDFDPILVATNVAFEGEATILEAAGMGRQSFELTSCQAAYLCHLQWGMDIYGETFLDIVEMDLIEVEPLPEMLLTVWDTEPVVTLDGPTDEDMPF